MGEETNAYDPAGSQFDDDVTAERPTDRAAQSGQKAQATKRATSLATCASTATNSPNSSTS